MGALTSTVMLSLTLSSLSVSPVLSLWPNELKLFSAPWHGFNRKGGECLPSKQPAAWWSGRSPGTCESEAPHAQNIPVLAARKRPGCA